MSEGTTLRERNIMPKVGPRFFRDGDAVMFEFVVDPNNVIGPRPAYKADSEKHREAFSEFAAADALPVKVQSPEPVIEPVAELVSFGGKLAFERAVADVGGTYVVTADGSEHATLAAASAHAHPEAAFQAAVKVARASSAKGKTRRKYTRRKVA